MNNNFDNPFYDNNNENILDVNSQDYSHLYSHTGFREERKNSIISIACYLASFYVLATIAQIVLIIIFANKYGINPANIMNHPEAYYATLSWSNFLTYIIAMLTVIPFMFKYLKQDFKESSYNIKETLKLVLIGIGIMYAASIFANLLVEVLTLNLEAPGTSENQEVIEALLGSGTTNAVLMCITTVIFAPILEEIIFRKCIFSLFLKKTYLTIAISAIIFAGIHVVPACITIFIDIIMYGTQTWTDLYLEAIYIISYLGQAIAMSYIYYKSNNNIVPSIIIHMFNNIIAVIAVFLI